MNECLNCSEPIRGRTDKKFCDAKCRNMFHQASRNELKNERTALKQIAQSAMNGICAGIYVNGFPASEDKEYINGLIADHAVSIAKKVYEKLK